MTKEYARAVLDTLRRNGLIPETMEHCLGLQYGFELRRNGIRCTRNYYTSYAPMKDMAEAVRKGFATMTPEEGANGRRLYLYRVTGKGFAELTRICGFGVEERP